MTRSGAERWAKLFAMLIGATSSEGVKERRTDLIAAYRNAEGTLRTDEWVWERIEGFWTAVHALDGRGERRVIVVDRTGNQILRAAERKGVPVPEELREVASALGSRTIFRRCVGRRADKPGRCLTTFFVEDRDQRCCSTACSRRYYYDRNAERLRSLTRERVRRHRAKVAGGQQGETS